MLLSLLLYTTITKIYNTRKNEEIPLNFQKIYVIIRISQSSRRTTQQRGTFIGNNSRSVRVLSPPPHTCAHQDSYPNTESRRTISRRRRRRSACMVVVHHRATPHQLSKPARIESVFVSLSRASSISPSDSAPSVDAWRSLDGRDAHC